MLRGKDRRHLRSLAVNIDPIFQIGKNGLTEIVIKEIDTAIIARELIKVRVLNSAPEDVHEIAPELALAIDAQLIQVIGHNIILFKQKKKDSKFILPN